MADLKDRVALVTGGSRGIGKSVALALARGGAIVAINYRERDTDANAVADAIRKNGGRAAAFVADVSRSAAVQGMVSDIEKRLGPIEILVNNAGMAAARGLDDITEEDFDRTIAINLKSVFLCTQAVLPGMSLRLAPSGVTANAVAPGLVDTDMGKPLIEAGVVSRIPVGRPGTGDEIAHAVLFLVENGYMTGQTIAVNGGSLFS